MKSDLLKICMASLLALSLTACGGDDSDDGGDDAACTANEKICSNDKLSVMTCKADGSGYDTQKCENGCENGACKADNGGNTKPNPTCKPDVNICSSNGNAVIKYNADCSSFETVESCSFGCTDGKCDAEKCKQGASKCSDDNSKALTCDANGSWIEADCEFGCVNGSCKQHTVLPEDADCDPDDYADTCSADGVLNYCAPVGYNDDYTDYVYGVVEWDCVSENMVCDIVNVNFDGEVVRYGNCFATTDECSTVDAVTTSCALEHDDYYDEDYAAYSEAICSASITSSKNYNVKYLSEDCVMGECKDAKSCVDPLVPDMGKECDPSDRPDRCDGNVLSTCTYTSIIDYFMGTMHVYAGDCADEDAVCDSGTVDGSSYANCFTSEDACTTIGDTQLRCDPDYGSIDTYKCTQLTNGKYWVYSEYSDCVNGCEEGATECNQPLVEDQGKECTTANRPDACDGSIISYCDGESVVAGDCAEEYGEGTVCAIANGQANCYEPEDACSEAGVETKGCYSQSGSNFAVKYVCTKTEAGLFNVMQTAAGTYTKCSNNCVDGECVKLVADEGETCKADTRPDRCDDQILSYCYSGVVKTLDCSSSTGYSCVVLNDGYGDCFSATSECSTAGETKTECDEYYAAYGYEISSTLKCVAAPNGKNYWEEISYVDCEETDQVCGSAGVCE